MALWNKRATKTSTSSKSTNFDAFFERCQMHTQGLDAITERITEATANFVLTTYRDAVKFSSLLDEARGKQNVFDTHHSVHAEDVRHAVCTQAHSRMLQAAEDGKLKLIASIKKYSEWREEVLRSQAEHAFDTAGSYSPVSTGMQALQDTLKSEFLQELLHGRQVLVYSPANSDTLLWYDLGLRVNDLFLMKPAAMMKQQYHYKDAAFLPKKLTAKELETLSAVYDSDSDVSLQDALDASLALESY